MANKPDSVSHHEEQRKKMREGAAQQQETDAVAAEHQEDEQNKRQYKARQEEIERLTTHAGLVKQGETREMLYERIRKLRTPLKEPEDVPGHRTESAEKAFNAEVEAGRARVAQIAKEQEEHRERWRKEDEEQKKREGEMTPVYRPNLSQKEQHPPKGTLNK
jgi:hypothetical protein